MRMIGHLGQMISLEWPNVRRLSKTTAELKAERWSDKREQKQSNSRIKSRATERQERREAEYDDDFQQQSDKIKTRTIL